MNQPFDFLGSLTKCIWKHLQSKLLSWEGPKSFYLKFLKSPKVFVQGPRFYLQSVFSISPLGEAKRVFWGEAVRIPHISVFLPRLIYLKGNLLSGHKRKISTKFIPVPIPLILSLGQQWIVGLETRVLFLLITTTSSELKRASLKSEIFILLEMSFHLNL